MLSRRTIILGAAWVAIARPALAADPGATAFVTAIYAAYKGKNAKGIGLDTEANIRRYFEPSLAALIIKDQKDAARRHDRAQPRRRSVRRCPGLGYCRLRYRRHRYGQ
jgi:hypothetical protein